MGCPELAVELDTLAKRNQAADRVQAAVSGWMAEHPADWLDEQLRLAEIPGSAIRPPWAGRTDRTIAYRQLLQPLGHPDRPGWESPYLGPRLPVALDGIPVELPPAEPLGASTDRVLTDLLGLTAPELDGLHERGVVRSADADGQV
jgi:crotonobetainyl-CoA:carnitine CoA-transferase CaiB-like acyl-CoA transferase